MPLLKLASIWMTGREWEIITEWLNSRFGVMFLSDNLSINAIEINIDDQNQFWLQWVAMKKKKTERHPTTEVHCVVRLNRIKYAKTDSLK